MRRVIGEQLYDTETADLLADDTFKDGVNRLTNGRATYLYRAPNGSYFEHRVTCCQGEQDLITPLSLDAALELYEKLNDEGAKEFTYAFPGVKIEEA